MEAEKIFYPVPRIFEHEQFGQVRFIEIDDEPWFVAVDLCRVLDIQNVRQNLAKLDEDEKMSVVLRDKHSTNGVTNSVCLTDGITGATFSNPCPLSKNDIQGGWVENRVNVVNEPGLYHLIFMSRKPEAKKFRRWVFHEVLPSIRRYGHYIAPHQEVIRIPGEKNFRAFKAKYPEGSVEVKKIIIEKEKTYYVVLHISA